MPPEEIRECRALVRGRKSFVEDRTEYINKIHGLLDQQGITRKVKPLSVEGREFLEELSLEAPWETLLETYLKTIDAFTERIASLEEEIEDRAASLPETQLLMTIPGVSSYSALLIYAELGEIERFDGSKQTVSFAGLNPVIRESGDSRFEGGISKTGSGDLRWILVQSAHTAVHKSHDEYLSRFYDRLQKRMSSKEAIVATARKLLVSIYHMLTRKEVYNPPGVSS